MARSINAMFRGKQTRSDHPPGKWIAELLYGGLATNGWAVAKIDNWRDCGWVVVCTQATTLIDVVVAKAGGVDTWILQIAASRYPNFIQRWFGGIPTADVESIYALAREAHEIVGSAGCRDFKWVWDDFPDSGRATSKPSLPPNHQA